MAVQDKGNEKNQPSKPAGYERTGYEKQEQPKQGYGRTAPGQTPTPRPGMASLNDRLRRTAVSERSETRSSEALRALREASEEAVATQTMADDHQLIRFDREQNQVGLSSILVVKMLEANAKAVVLVRPLILETTDVRLPARKIHQGSQRVEFPTRAQDVYNDRYWGKIEGFLKRHFGNENLIVVDAGPLLVPDYHKADDSGFNFDNHQAVRDLLIDSSNRCDDVAARVEGEIPIDISLLKRDDERFTARIDFTGEPTHDLVGQPIRSDMVVTMSSQTTSNEELIDYYQADTELNSVTMYVNLEYTPQLAQRQQGLYGQQVGGPTPLFTPAVVITSVNNGPWIRANTPELYMLAISNAYRVTANTAWAKCFLPQVGTKGIDPRDIGAIGYLTPAGSRAPTKEGSFEDKDFVQLMTQFVHPKPSFLIDVNPVGENSLLEGLLIDAAYEGAHRQEAINKLIKAADNLTGNRFSEIFEADKYPLVIPCGQEVHLGSYVGAGGERRDIRDLDVLAMLNYTDGNIAEFEEWYSTWVDTGDGETFEAKMQRREQLERHYLKKDLKITGRAVRLMLHPEFVDALDAATYEAGVQVDMENVSNVMGAQRFMGNTMISQYTVQGGARTGGYNTPSAGRGHHYQAGVTGQGRYNY